MACEKCEQQRKKLRDAIMRGKLSEVVDVTVEGLRVMIGIDAGADHRKEAAATLAPAPDKVPAKAAKAK